MGLVPTTPRSKARGSWCEHPEQLAPVDFSLGFAARILMGKNCRARSGQQSRSLDPTTEEIRLQMLLMTFHGHRLHCPNRLAERNTMVPVSLLCLSGQKVIIRKPFPRNKKASSLMTSAGLNVELILK